MARGLLRARRVARRVAARYDEDAFLAREVGDRLLSRVSCVRMQPQLVLDLGAGTGADLPALRKRFPFSSMLALDASEVMLAAVPRFWRRRPQRGVADAHLLPLPDDSVDLVYSNLMLPWCARPELVLAELWRVLRPGGVLFFSTLSPETAERFRAKACAERLPDMPWWGAAMLREGFADPVVDVDRIYVDYSSRISLVRDMRVFGLAYLLRRAGHFERLGLRLDVLFGHASKGFASTLGVDGAAPIHFVPRGN